MVDPRLRRFSGPLAAFAAMSLVVMGSGAVLFARKLGLTAARVQGFYLGGGEGGTPARSLAGMTEVLVPHLLAVPMLVFVTLHLVAFATRARRRPFALLSAITWGCAAVGILSGLAIRWIWPALAPLKIAAFVGMEATMLLWLGYLAAALWPAGVASRARVADDLEPSGQRR